MTEIFNDRKQASQDDKAEVEHVDWATTLAPGEASIEDLPEQQYSLSVYLAMLVSAFRPCRPSPLVGRKSDSKIG